MAAEIPTAAGAPHASAASDVGMTPSGMMPKDIMRTAITRPRSSGGSPAWMAVLFVAWKIICPTPIATRNAIAIQSHGDHAKSAIMTAIAAAPANMILPLSGRLSMFAEAIAPASPPTPMAAERRPSRIAAPDSVPSPKTSCANTGCNCWTGNANSGISIAANMSMRRVGSPAM
jgi:hypothetical protein